MARCGVRSGQIRNAEYGIWNAEYGIWNTEYGIRSDRNTEYGVIEILDKIAYICYN